VLFGIFCSSRCQLVPTPFGVAHSSCVHRVPSGSSFREDARGTVAVTPDGQTMEFPKCEYSASVVREKSLMHFKDYSAGWQAWTTFDAQNTSIDSYEGFFSVPDIPSWVGEQAIFVFIGLQTDNWVPGPNSPPAPEHFALIQPALQFGNSPAGGGPFWGVATWFVTMNHGYLVSDLVQVNPGDSIWGSLSRVNGNTWSMEATVSGVTSNQTVQSNRLWNLPFAYCAMEVFHIGGDCTAFPTNPVDFTQLKITVGQQQAKANWMVNTTMNPMCNEGAKVIDPTQIVISF